MGNGGLFLIAIFASSHILNADVQVLEKVRQLTIDISEIKQNQRQILSQIFINAEKSNVADEQSFFHRVDLAVACLENGVPSDMHITDDSLSAEQLNSAYFLKSYSKIGLACDMLSMFIKNVVKHPESQRFRKISTSNANYKTMLGNLIGYQRVLSAVGFVLRGAAWEWEWADDHATIDITTPGVRSGDDKPKPELASKVMQYMLDKLQVLRSEEYRASVAANVIESTEKAPAPEPEPAPNSAVVVKSAVQTAVVAAPVVVDEEMKVSSTPIIEKSASKSASTSKDNLVDIMKDIDDLTATPSGANKPLGTPYNQRGYSFSSRGGGLLGTANLPIGLRFDDVSLFNTFFE